MVKKILLLISLSVMLTGCSDGGNVSSKAYLRAVSVDGNKLTFAFFSEDNKPITVTADSPSEAKEIAELSIGKEIFTGHTELIMLKNCDSREMLGFMLHEWKLSPSCMIAKPEFNGRTVLALAKPEKLTGSIKVAQEQGIAPECDIITVLGGLLGNGRVQTAEISENGFTDVTELK